MFNIELFGNCFPLFLRKEKKKFRNIRKQQINWSLFKRRKITGSLLSPGIKHAGYKISGAVVNVVRNNDSLRIAESFFKNNEILFK